MAVPVYYTYLLISAMMDLLSDEIPPKFYERLRHQILSKPWWSVCVRYLLLDVAWQEKDRQDGPFGPVPEQWWVVALLVYLPFKLPHVRAD